jgi:hypothetical protein
VLAYYRRQLPRRGEHRSVSLRLSDQGAWLDVLEPGSAAGRKRSTDILIHRPDPDLHARADEEEKLIIEILSIEIHDPAADQA